MINLSEKKKKLGEEEEEGEGDTEEERDKDLDIFIYLIEIWSPIVIITSSTLCSIVRKGTLLHCIYSVHT